MSAKPRLLCVITSLTPGGAERQLLNLLRGLRDDYQVRLVALRGGHLQPSFEELGIAVEVVDLQTIVDLPRVYRHLVHIMSQWQPDLVQSFLPHANILSKLAVLVARHSPIVVTGVRNSKIHFHLQLGERLTDWLADYIVTNSTTNKRMLCRWGFPAPKITVIYNGIVFRQPTEVYSYDRPTILTVAKFMQQKDYHTNVLVIKQLITTMPHVQVLYVGQGPLFAAIKQLISDQGLTNHISLLGVRDDIPELMHSADVFFLPSRYEGQANVLLEAMYYELPIVTTDIPENREICQALFAPVGDVQAMAEQLQLALQKRETLKPLIKQNKARVQDFTVQRMQESYKKLYKSHL